MKTRILWSVVLTVIYGAAVAIWRNIYAQMTGIAAARTLNDDTVIGNAFSRWFRSGDAVGGVAFLVFVLVLVLIWWPVVRRALKNSAPLMILLVVGLAVVGCTPRASNESESYRSPDIIEVQPNQTAFQIPATGGNQSEQVQFDSVSYLESKKVAAKRVQIDKELLGGKYIPTSFVILVDRTPVARQWTLGNETGTSAGNEALCAESNESIEVCFQISMAASVKEADAATYLYNFPTAKEQSGQVGGVYLATPLADVVDNQVRQYAQSIIGSEVASRSLRQVIADKISIVNQAESNAKEYFAGQGITIAYLGLGGQLGLSNDVQSVINKMFVAQTEVEIAQIQATTVAINAQSASNAAQIRAEGDAKALELLVAALGGDPALLGQALEGYRWNGSRVTVMVTSDTPPAIAVPVTTPQPVVVPTPTPEPTATPGS